MTHLAIIGCGRVGRITAYTLLSERIVEELSVVDIKPSLAKAFTEELKHSAASLKFNVKINYFERSEDLPRADIIIVTAGYPRIPGVKMSRRDLAAKNGEIIKSLAEILPKNSGNARYLIVTNPVDAMATLFQKVSGEKFVVSSGTHMDTLRFKSKLSHELGVPVSSLDGYVGGEHGPSSVILWSTVKVNGVNLDDYLREVGGELNRSEVEGYVREVAKFIIDNTGETEFGPASAFRDIVKAIALNRNDLFSISIPMKFESLPEAVHVGVPVRVGWNLGSNLFNRLSEDEREAVESSAKKIYEVYREVLIKYL